MVATGRLESLLSENLALPDVVWQRLRSETDHELRAALICLLTAALADEVRPQSLAKLRRVVLASAVVIVGALGDTRTSECRKKGWR